MDGRVGGLHWRFVVSQTNPPQSPFVAAENQLFSARRQVHEFINSILYISSSHLQSKKLFSMRLTAATGLPLSLTSNIYSFQFIDDF